MHPNTDWIGDADWVLDDNDERDAEIEAKIIEFYPNFELVLNDDGSKIVHLDDKAQLFLSGQLPSKQEY